MFIKFNPMGNFNEDQNVNEMDYVYNTSIFSGFKRIIQSKTFKGGNITLIFGGIELDFSYASPASPAIIDINQAFGEVKLFLPDDWFVDTQINHLLSVVKEHRFNPAQNASSGKVLVIKGFSVFAAIEINPARASNI